ncbi:cation-translocating P-type ATPase [Enterococcus sp. LJL128]
MMKEQEKILTNWETDGNLGLTEAQAKERLLQYGANTISQEQSKHFFTYLLAALKDITIIILLIATVLSSYVAFTAHPDDFTEPIVIFGIVLLNIFLSVHQQKKAEKSMEELKSYNLPKSRVIREGRNIEVESTDIVPGDILDLTLGDRVPADAQLLESVQLSVEESFLTGESEPSEKDEHYQSTEKDSIGDQKNRLFSGSLIVNGRGKAVVTATGRQSEIGKISSLLSEEKAVLAPLQIKMQKLGKILGLVAIGSGLLAILIGLLRGYPLEVTIMTAISMSVAAIPEVLPVVVTISLSYGISNMAKHNTVVRTPTAVETIGNVSVICSDKTGTITENKMTVKKLWAFGEASAAIENTLTQKQKELLILFYLSSNISGDPEAVGNPTERAIAKLVEKRLEQKELERLAETYQRVHEIPFDSKNKRMTTVYKIAHRYISITKGAVDRLPLSKESEKASKDIQAYHDELAGQAYRVLGVAYKEFAVAPSTFTPEYLEKDLTFAGLVGIIDPPRKESYQAVAVARKAGIRTIMITGDHLLTAKKIAADVGILTDGTKAMTGAELGGYTERELAEIIHEYRVFARTSPEDKIRIVKALQGNNEIVGMTGDGVNDAPALKAADVGIAMGSGTEVAKEAADMILLDDNFATIVEAVKEGRRVYSNIRKSLYAMLGCNISALTIVLISMLLGWGAPVTAIQLLIIKVVADGIPGFSLCVEPSEKNSMKQQPVSKGSSIFADGLLKKIIDISIVFTILTLLSIYAGRYPIFGISDDHLTANTMTFLVLGLTTIIHMYNCRSKNSIFTIGLLTNKLLLGTTAAGALLLILLVALPQTASVLHFAPLSFYQWLIVLGLSVMPLVYVEVKKLGRSRYERSLETL